MAHIFACYKVSNIQGYNHDITNLIKALLFINKISKCFLLKPPIQFCLSSPLCANHRPLRISGTDNSGSSSLQPGAQIDWIEIWSFWKLLHLGVYTFFTHMLRFCGVKWDAFNWTEQIIMFLIVISILYSFTINDVAFVASQWLNWWQHLQNWLQLPK